MPFIFAHKPKANRANPTTYEVGGVAYEPTKVSAFTTHTKPYVISVLTSYWTTFISWIVLVASYPKGTYESVQSLGGCVNSMAKKLPFRNCNLGFHLRPGSPVLDQITEANTLARGFTTFQMGKRSST